MCIEQVRFAQPLALTRHEVIDDAGETQGADGLAANFLAQIEKRTRSLRSEGAILSCVATS